MQLKNEANPAVVVKVFTSVLIPSFTSFMLMAFLPLSLPFFLFFFLNIHFLQMQKQQETTSTTATNAMATIAHDGSGILCSSFMNLFLTLENISSLVSRGPGPAASVLLPGTSGAAVGAGFPTRASLRLIAGCGSQAEALTQGSLLLKLASDSFSH